MATNPADGSFDARFRAFYEGCTDEEQRFLEAVIARAAATEEGDDVSGFAAAPPPAGAPLGGTTALSSTELWGVVSNIMKTKHDTVKNSISNVR